MGKQAGALPGVASGSIAATCLSRAPPGAPVLSRPQPARETTAGQLCSISAVGDASAIRPFRASLSNGVQPCGRFQAPVIRSQSNFAPI